MKGEIYKITNTSNGKIYIGQTVRGVSKRWKEHCSKSVCPKLHKAIVKYGADRFTVEVIWSGTGESSSTKRCLDALEIAYIQYFDSINTGYNISSGGKGTVGYHHTDEAKEKMSKAKKGVHMENSGTFKKGGRSPRSKPVLQYSLDGSFIKRYETATEAAIAIGRSFSKVCAAARGEQSHCGGYIWRYETA